MDSNCNSRQRDSAEGDKRPQRELEQHGGASTGRTGGLQSKTVVVIQSSCAVFFFIIIKNMQYYTSNVLLHHTL